MKATLKTTLYILPLLIAGACDTTEDAYWPGPEPTDILSADVAEIHLNADGTPQDVNITAICSWDALLTDNENVFTIAPTTGKGDGIISVSADHNYGSTVKSSTLEVQAKNFSKKVTINVMQSSLIFEMDSKEYPEIDEEGGSVDLSFKSTTGWAFTVRANDENPDNVGSLDWFDFIPGSSGIGDYYELKVKANWKPNYTLEEREITLVLTPINQDILDFLDATKIPQPFTLKQKAGTKPTNVVGDTVSVTKTDIDYRLSYASKSPITECGVRILNAAGQEIKTVTANKDAEGYPQNGQVSVNISGLEEGGIYTLEPYVINMVGETMGNPMTIRMDANVIYSGVTITNYDIITTSKSVTALVSVDSDINVTEVGISIYNDIYRDQPIVTYTQPTSGTSFTIDVSSTDLLSPNSDGELVIFARTIVNEAITGRIPFRTKGLNPTEGDNDTPDVEK